MVFLVFLVFLPALINTAGTVGHVLAAAGAAPDDEEQTATKKKKKFMTVLLFFLSFKTHGKQNSEAENIKKAWDLVCSRPVRHSCIGGECDDDDHDD